MQFVAPAVPVHVRTDLYRHVSTAEFGLGERESGARGSKYPRGVEILCRDILFPTRLRYRFRRGSEIIPCIRIKVRNTSHPDAQPRRRAATPRWRASGPPPAILARYSMANRGYLNASLTRLQSPQNTVAVPLSSEVSFYLIQRPREQVAVENEDSEVGECASGHAEAPATSTSGKSQNVSRVRGRQYRGRRRYHARS